LQPNYLLNSQKLGDRLNEKDAFDNVIEFKPKDQLEIVINNLSDDKLDRMSFCFIFKKGKWIEKEYDTFEIMSRYDELAFGDFDKVSDK
jgi:predicted metal-dependent hydrolase